MRTFRWHPQNTHVVDGAPVKYCSMCHERFPATREFFYFYKDAPESACKACRRESPSQKRAVAKFLAASKQKTQERKNGNKTPS